MSSKSSPQSLRNSILRYVVLASNQVISLEDTAVTQSGNCFLLNRVHSSCKTELHLLQCRHMKQEPRELSSKLKTPPPCLLRHQWASEGLLIDISTEREINISFSGVFFNKQNHLRDENCIWQHYYSH